MTTDRFNDEFDDELLSAYVDGELTADERALVEERLRTDPQAAQLVEELRSLSSAVKSLPRETLGRDLRESVWSEIEHVHEGGDGRHVIPLSEPLDPPRGFRRGFLWSSIAIAAALMLMFIQEQEQDGDRDVAAVAKNEAEQGAADRESSRPALKDGELPNLGEMRSLDPPRDEAMPAAPAAAEPSGTTDSAPTEDSELERPANEPAARQRQLAQSTPQPDLMKALADQDEREVGPSDALGAAAPPAPAAMPIDQPATPVATVELQVKAEDGLTRFKRHLAENNFALPAPTGESAEGISGAFGSESESAAASIDAKSRFAVGGKLSSDADRAPVEVLVEGSPEQIESLVASFQTDRSYFAEVNAPDYLTRNRLFRYGAAPTGGAAAGSASTTLDAAGELETRGGLAGQPQSRVGGPGDGAEQPAAAAGRAWILSYGRFTGGGGGQVADKAKETLAESAVELNAPAEEKRESVQRSASLEFRRQSESLAKQLSEPPEAGRVRVRFVLRAAQPPQPAAAAPASADP
jgi:hypothetical protein